MKRQITLTLITLLLALALTACGGGEQPAGEQPAGQAEEAAGNEEGGEEMFLRVGVSPIPHAEILNFVKENLAVEAGLEIEVVEFTDYVQPNLALQDGEIDANYFQHVPYMENFAQERGIDMVSVVPVHIEAFGIYSNKVESLEEVPDGAMVAIPNDATNAGRALNLLAENGLLTLREGAGISATVDDIEENPKNLEITELEAAQLPRVLEDVTLSVINGNYALEADLQPSEDALAIEAGEENPYANVLAVLNGQQDDPAVQKLAELLNSPEVKEFILKQYEGAVIPAFGAEQP